MSLDELKPIAKTQFMDKQRERDYENRRKFENWVVQEFKESESPMPFDYYGKRVTMRGTSMDFLIYLDGILVAEIVNCEMRYYNQELINYLVD